MNDGPNLFRCSECKQAQQGGEQALSAVINRANQVHGRGWVELHSTFLILHHNQQNCIQQVHPTNNIYVYIFQNCDAADIFKIS